MTTTTKTPATCEHGHPLDLFALDAYCSECDARITASAQEALRRNDVRDATREHDEDPTDAAGE